MAPRLKKCTPRSQRILLKLVIKNLDFFRHLIKISFSRTNVYFY